jgi:hypothetical protein
MKVGPPALVGRSALERPIRLDRPAARITPGITWEFYLPLFLTSTVELPTLAAFSSSASALGVQRGACLAREIGRSSALPGSFLAGRVLPAHLFLH